MPICSYDFIYISSIRFLTFFKYFFISQDPDIIIYFKFRLIIFINLLFLFKSICIFNIFLLSFLWSQFNRGMNRIVVAIYNLLQIIYIFFCFKRYLKFINLIPDGFVESLNHLTSIWGDFFIES